MDVLSREELEFFAEEGYVVAREVIDRDQAERTARAVWAFTGMDPDDSGTWYPEERRGIMVEIYQHQTMWDNRTAPRVHRAFSQVWGTDKLWVSHDRASISPPALDKDAPEHGLHWDASLDNRPLPFGVQGVLYLNDTPAEQGAFVCVPGVPPAPGGVARRVAGGGRPPRPGPAGPGDASHRRRSGGPGHLAHRPAAHGQPKPRRQSPSGAVHHHESRRRQRRGAAQAHRLLAAAALRAGRYAEEREAREGKTAELTSLGRKLAGVDPWE